MQAYREIFNAAEKTLREQSKLSSEDFAKVFGEFKEYESRTLSDREYFDILVQIIFYAGMRADTVTKKLPTIRKHFPDPMVVASYGDRQVREMMNDRDMIKHKPKIMACVHNASVFMDIINRYGSFKKYVDSFVPKGPVENLNLLKEEIQRKFNGLGPINVYHFLTDIGLPVLKPDRVIMRVFSRIGLIKSDDPPSKAIDIGLKVAQETGHPIRYIDIIFVQLGQMGNEEFGLKGICLENNPRCSVCEVKPYCDYYKSEYRRYGKTG